VLHVHSIEADRAGGQGGNPLVREVEDVAFHAVDQIVAVSEFTRQAIAREYDIPLDKIAVIHNSFEHTDIVPIEQPHVTTFRYLQALQLQGYRVVTYVGRLTVQKGVDNLLKAAKIVIDKAPKTMFLITGDGEQLHELVQLAADLGIGRNVLFTGFLRGKSWRDSFNIGDLFVMPSVSEPFGLVALEAIAYGTPSLITKQSGVAEVLHSTLQVDFWDVHEMANQIIAAVQNQPLRDELHKNATLELQRMSWRDAAHKFTNLYEKHLTGKAA
jgi:glycogen(starch) synthase